MHMDDYLQIDTNNNHREIENKNFSKEDLAFIFQLFQQANNNVNKESNLSKDKNSNKTNKEEKDLPKVKEGSIYQRKDGRWQGKYYDDGKRKTIYAKSKLEIIEKLNKTISERDKYRLDTLATNKPSLNKWIDIWFNKFKKPKLKKSTIDDYESNVINKVKRHSIGKKQIGKITPMDLELFLQSIEAASVKARTYRQLKTIFKAAFNYKIISDNPMSRIDRISEPKSKKQFPEAEDFDKLLAYTKEQNYDMYLFIKFLSLSGLRKGEALALTWDDIKNNRIHVNKAYETHAKKIQSPKNANSIRQVPILPEAQKILDELDKNSKYIFSNIYKDAVSKRLRIYNKRLGTNITLHTFRHYYTTLCTEAGINLKTINTWTGRTSTKVTLGTYTHMNPDFENSEYNKMAKYSASKEK